MGKEKRFKKGRGDEWEGIENYKGSCELELSERFVGVVLGIEIFFFKVVIMVVVYLF